MGMTPSSLSSAPNVLQLAEGVVDDDLSERRRAYAGARATALACLTADRAFAARLARLELVDAVARLNQHSSYRVKVRLAFGPRGPHDQEVLAASERRAAASTP